MFFLTKVPYITIKDAKDGSIRFKCAHTNCFDDEQSVKFSWTFPQDLLAHWRAKHARDKKYTCSTCNRDFFEIVDYEAHVSLHPTDLQNYLRKRRALGLERKRAESKAVVSQLTERSVVLESESENVQISETEQTRPQQLPSYEEQSMVCILYILSNLGGKHGRGYLPNCKKPTKG